MEVAPVAFIAVILIVQSWREHQYDLSGKTVSITGGSRGLGLVMSHMLLEQGARLATSLAIATNWNEHELN